MDSCSVLVRTHQHGIAPRPGLTYDHRPSRLLPRRVHKHSFKRQLHTTHVVAVGWGQHGRPPTACVWGGGSAFLPIGVSVCFSRVSTDRLFTVPYFDLFFRGIFETRKLRLNCRHLPPSLFVRASATWGECLKYRAGAGVGRRRQLLNVT